LDHLLVEIGPDAPCGDNLEYDAAFMELEQAAKPKAEQQFGSTVIPGEEPDWVEIRKLALGLLDRTKDLRVYDQLLRASVKLDGMAGLSSSLKLLRSVLDLYWDGLHPQLDPDDDLDPTARVNIIAGLTDPSTVLRSVREAPLVSSRTFGRFSLREIGSDVPAEAQPDAATVNAAFLDVALETLQETAAAVRSAMDDVRGIEAVITDKVGASNAPDLSALGTMLRDAARVLDARLSSRGVGAEEVAGEEVAEEGGVPTGSRPAGVSAPGQIASRDDVLRTLDRLCDYYARYEPSSPVPVLLLRAKRLVPLSFMDILQDLIPDAVSMAQVYTGPQPEE
jgi:type VI secretion system protein ImpA